MKKKTTKNMIKLVRVTPTTAANVPSVFVLSTNTLEYIFFSNQQAAHFVIYCPYV